MVAPYAPGSRFDSDVPRPCTACERPTLGRIVAVNRDPHNPHADGATFGAALCGSCRLPPIEA